MARTSVMDTRERIKPEGVPANDTISLNVNFNGFSFGGGQTCRLGCSFEQGDHGLDVYEYFFNGSQCRVTLSADGAGKDDVDGQTTFIDTSKAKFSGVANIKGFGVHDNIGFGMTFTVREIDREGLLNLIALAGSEGKLKCKRIGDIEESDASNAEADADDADLSDAD